LSEEFCIKRADVATGDCLCVAWPVRRPHPRQPRVHCDVSHQARPIRL